MKTFAFLVLTLVVGAAAAFGGYRYCKLQMQKEIDEMAVQITKHHKQLNSTTIAELRRDHATLKDNVEKLKAELLVKSTEVQTVTKQASTSVAQLKTENQALKGELEALKKPAAKPVLTGNAAASAVAIPSGMQRVQ